MLFRSDNLNTKPPKHHLSVRTFGELKSIISTLYPDCRSHFFAVPHLFYPDLSRLPHHSRQQLSQVGINKLPICHPTSIRPRRVSLSTQTHETTPSSLSDAGPLSRYRCDTLASSVYFPPDRGKRFMQAGTMTLPR